MMARILCSGLLFLLVCTIGCSNNAGNVENKSGEPEAGSSTEPSTSKGTIAFSALTLKNPFFKIIADNLTEEGGRLGFEVIVNDADRDVNTQSKHIDDYIAQKVSAIVINPADRVAIGPAVKKANDAGIPVFTCDLECISEDAKIAGHVGTDNYQGGKLAGEAVVEALGEAGGEVLVLHFKQANSCVLRVDGFKEVIDAHNKDKETGKIEVIAELEGGGLQDEGFRATSDALQAHPNLVAIFAINDPSALGAATALKQAGKQDQVKVIGFDGQLDGKQAIKDGKILADPIQFPDQMGKVTAQNVAKYLNGEEFESVQLIPAKLYTKADADQDPDLE